MSNLPTLKNMSSLDDARQALSILPGPDKAAATAAAEREPQLTKPAGSLGRLEDLSAWLATWQRRHPPRMECVRARVFAGNHGVVAQGVSAFPAEVTAQMVGNFEAGGAAVNQLCQTMDVELKVEALDLDSPTRDFTIEPAMSGDECARAMKRGAAAVTAGTDLLCLGEMGIGNTTSAAALCHALYGGTADEWTGPGTGVSGEALSNKARVVAGAVELHSAEAGGDSDTLETLRRLGGRELAAIAGAILEARLTGVPVLLDGYVCSAAAAVLERGWPGALDHCQVAHTSMEPGHTLLLGKLNKTALFDLGMRLGEASGAVLAVGLLRCAAACHNGMATFGEAGVADKE